MLKRAGIAVSVMCLFTGAVAADPAETMKAAGEDASWLFIQTAPNSMAASWFWRMSAR